MPQSPSAAGEASPGAAASDAPETPTTFDSVIKRIARVDTQPGGLVSGQVIGGTYELLERLGGGGMGVVFRARDRKLGRDVAVKVLRAAGADDHLRTLFDREARATAQLLHPHIVTLHHVGEHDGLPYLVLELLVGETLASRLARRGALGVPETALLADGVLAALSFAHERGVLHRDLKPNNVFVTVDERVKVLDFGIALSVDTDPGPVTRSAGTPGYMAPEQRDGGAQDVRTDVWAAALLVLECLLGRRPDEREAATLAEKLTAPAAVRAVLSRALAADPMRRPESAHALRAELARATGLKSVPIARRSRWWYAVAVVPALAVGAAGALALSHSRTPTGPIRADELNNQTFHLNFGEMRMHVEPDGTAYGVYDQGSGIQVGTFANDHWTGWWCQLPTRKPTDDAGPFDLHFVRGESRILIEGEYKYGDGRAAAWRKDFYGVSIDGPPPYELERRIQHHELCPR
ncbi:MAG TPA: serine/threonine-protein kinase [Kofleriaceae bacterium]